MHKHVQSKVGTNERFECMIKHFVFFFNIKDLMKKRWILSVQIFSKWYRQISLFLSNNIQASSKIYNIQGRLAETSEES